MKEDRAVVMPTAEGQLPIRKNQLNKTAKQIRKQTDQNRVLTNIIRQTDRGQISTANNQGNKGP